MISLKETIKVLFVSFEKRLYKSTICESFYYEKYTNIGLMKKHKVCPACFKNKNKIFFKSVNKDNSIKNFNYLKCSNCKSIFLSKENLSDEKLNNYHKHYWYKENQFSFEPKQSSEKNIISFCQTYKNLNLKKNSIVLDVGCGDGSFLIALERMKFKKLYGFDTDNKVLRKIKNRNINTFESNFSNFYNNKMIFNRKFDYIFLHDVLEHSFNPRELLLNIKKVMKKKSTIFIKIPSGECLQLEMLKEYNWTSFAPFHRTLFSKKGIGVLLKKMGFNKIEFIPSKTRNWGWTRGISWKLKLSKLYEKLRKNKKFRQFDYEIDDLFEKISIKINKEPTIFLKCEKK